jgi:uncharacterized protein with PQ loop repeat
MPYKVAGYKMNNCNKTNDDIPGNSGNSGNPDVELFMTIIVNIGNVLSILYNLPQMWRTYKLKKADDISSYFLWMRLSSGIIWSIYCIYYRMWNVIISWATTIISTIQILYYKYYPSPLAQRQLVEEEQQEGQQGQDRGQGQEQVFEMSEQNNNGIYLYQNRIVQLN